MKIELFDTFNGWKISGHRSLLAAVKAQRRHLAAIRRRNGRDSYVTFAFRYADGTPVDEQDLVEARLSLDAARY